MFTKFFFLKVLTKFIYNIIDVISILFIVYKYFVITLTFLSWTLWYVLFIRVMLQTQ